MARAGRPLASRRATPGQRDVLRHGGQLDPETGTEKLQVLTNLTPGSVAGFKYLDFGDDATQELHVTVRAKAASTGFLEVCLDAPTPANRIGRIPLDGAQVWRDYSAPVGKVTGVHAVYLVANTTAKTLGDVSFLEFSNTVQ